MSRFPASLAGRYPMTRVLGRGSFGTVFLCEDASLGRSVAVKILRAGMDVPKVRARFEREARLTAALEHPNVVAVYDHGVTEEGLAYIVYEYLVGKDLTGRRVDAGGGLPPAEVARWGAQVADALEAVHAAGVVHRDVKPDNILVTEDDRAVLCDFGIARPDSGRSVQTRAGIVLGTPAYLAPEAWAGAEPSPVLDQYALAATLYEAVLGHRLRPGKTLEDILEQIRGEATEIEIPEFAPPHPALRAVLRRALARDPAARFPDMAAMARALRAEEPTPPPGPAPPRKTRVPVAAMAGLFLAAAAVGVVASRPPPPREISTPAPAPLVATRDPAATPEGREVTRRFEDFARGHLGPDGALDLVPDMADFREHVERHGEWILDPRFPMRWLGMLQALERWLEEVARGEGMRSVDPDLLELPEVATLVERVAYRFGIHALDDVARFDARIYDGSSPFEERKLPPQFRTREVLESAPRREEDLRAAGAALVAGRPLAWVPIPILINSLHAASSFHGEGFEAGYAELRRRLLELEPGRLGGELFYFQLTFLARGIRRLNFDCGMAREDLGTYQRRLLAGRSSTPLPRWRICLRILVENHAALWRDCAETQRPEGLADFREAVGLLEDFLPSDPSLVRDGAHNAYDTLARHGAAAALIAGFPRDLLDRLRALEQRARELRAAGGHAP